MENFQDRNVWIRIRSWKKSWIWIRFVLRGWIRIRLFLRGLDPVNIRLDPKPCLLPYEASCSLVGLVVGRSSTISWKGREVKLLSHLSDHLFHLESRRSHLMTFVSWTARPLSRFINTTTIRNTKLNIEYKYKIVWCVCAPACARVCVCLCVYHAANWDIKLIKSCFSQIVIIRFSVSTWVQLNDHTWF